MLTEPNQTDAGAWVTLTELSRIKGVGKAAMSERVSRLESQGLLTSRRKGKAKLLNLAQFDQAVGETSDLSRLQGAATKREQALDEPPLPPSPVDPNAPSYTREQARHMAYKADLAKLELDQRLGRVLPIDEVTGAMVRCAEALTRTIDQLPTRADELAAAVAKDGAAGARAMLKSVARDLRALLGREMQLLHDEGAGQEAAAPEADSEDSE